MLCKEGGYRTEYIVESSIYSVEYLGGLCIMLYHLTICPDILLVHCLEDAEIS